MGVYLCADDNIRVCNNTDVARLLVRTKHYKVLSEEVEVVINGCSFSINIMEDSQGTKHPSFSINIIYSSSDDSCESDDDNLNK